MSFPTTLDDFTNPAPAMPTNSMTIPLSTAISQLNNAVEEIEAKIGISGSQVAGTVEKRLIDTISVSNAAYSIANTGLSGARTAINVPDGFGFDFAKLPTTLSLYRKPSGTIEWTYDYLQGIPSGCKSAPLSRIIHVSNSGSSGNTGVGAYLGDFSNAKVSIGAAITYGNSLGAAYRVVVKSGTYLRNEAWNVAPTQDCWIQGWIDETGVKPVSTANNDYTWTLDGTYTNCYKTTRSAALRVFDSTYTDAQGCYRELTKQASLSACNTNPNSWYTDGTTVYVYRQDGQAPTTVSTLLMINVNVYLTASGGGDLYVSNMRFFGGTGAFTGCPTKTATLVDCDFAYQGGSALAIDALQILDFKQVVCVRCRAYCAYKDGINVHANGGNIPQLLTLDCSGWRNGAAGILSCNGWTTHDAVKAIDVNGRYYANRGFNIACVDDSTHSWLIGTNSAFSYGDGTSPPCAYYFTNAGSYWMDSCVGEQCEYNLWVTLSAQVKTHSCIARDCRIETSATGGAAITAY